MAGGKETPRQKMIGMMYLVLTALLALNVSKSILDAFVAIEENIQKANIVQADRGTGFVDDVRSEITSSKGADQAAKKQKLEYVLGQMKKIDDETAKFIEFTDKLKVAILKQAGEKADVYNDKHPESILWIKQNGVKPARMHLAAVQGQDKYDEPMLVLGISEDIKNPTGDGAELWKRLNDFRSKIVELTGAYTWGEGSKFTVKVDNINEFETNQELIKKVTAMIDKNEKSANLKEDRQVLIDLYMMLTKKERNDVHDKKGVHCVGMTFDHSPLVAAIASLSSMQQDVLSARALALAHWKSKVSTGEYSFNKIMPLAHGDLIANTGDSAYVKVMMAAFDSDNQPNVVVLEGAADAKVNVKDGQGIVGFKVAGGTEQVLKGTVAIKNKSGVWKTEPWEHKITIMKPSGAISLPELNVLYKGYANQVEAVASGFDQTTLTGSVPISKTATGWVATPNPGPGRDATLTVSGKNSVTGKSQQLLTKPFKLRNMPKPDLQWGTAVNGGKGTKQETRIAAKYGDEVPLTANFTIKSWAVTVSGLMGEPTGSGGQLSAEAMSLIRQARPGSSVTIFAEVIGPDKTPKRITSVFKI
jgi:gliding motility-associated protein GldM